MRYYILSLSLLIVSVHALEGCNFELPPTNRYNCRPDYPSDCIDGYVCKPETCPGPHRCQPWQPGEREHYPLRCVVDGFCDEEACESCFSCPGDCCMDCDPDQAVDAPVDYLVSGYEADCGCELLQFGCICDQGVDVNGDGEVDNRIGLVLLGSLFQMMSIMGPDDEIAEWLAEGKVLIVVRVFDGYPAQVADGMMYQVLLAEMPDATPLFDGNDVVTIAPDASTDMGLCGRGGNGRFFSENTTSTLRFPIPHFGEGGMANLELHRARLERGSSWDGSPTVQLGGGLRPQDVRDFLYPGFSELFTQAIAEDPFRDTVDIIVDALDGNCSALEDVAGCEALVNGEGECADDQWPAVITTTELACSSWLDGSSTKPDLDGDGDGVDDLLSFGVRLTLVPVTIID